MTFVCCYQTRVQSYVFDLEPICNHFFYQVCSHYCLLLHRGRFSWSVRVLENTPAPRKSCPVFHLTLLCYPVLWDKAKQWRSYLEERLKSVWMKLSSEKEANRGRDAIVSTVKSMSYPIQEHPRHVCPRKCRGMWTASGPINPSDAPVQVCA